MTKFTKRAIALITAGMLAVVVAPAQAQDCSECVFDDSEGLVITYP